MFTAKFIHSITIKEKSDSLITILCVDSLLDTQYEAFTLSLFAIFLTAFMS
jgi:predicted transcriptional regulator YheO